MENAEDAFSVALLNKLMEAGVLIRDLLDYKTLDNYCIQGCSINFFLGDSVER